MMHEMAALVVETSATISDLLNGLADLFHLLGTDSTQLEWARAVIK